MEATGHFIGVFSEYMYVSLGIFTKVTDLGKFCPGRGVPAEFTEVGIKIRPEHVFTDVRPGACPTRQLGDQHLQGRRQTTVNILNTVHRRNCAHNFVVFCCGQVPSMSQAYFIGFTPSVRPSRLLCPVCNSCSCG